MLNYHKELINQINSEPLRNYYHIENEDVTNLTSFNFAFFKKETDKVLTIKPKKSIKVPSCIQLLGYDKNQYTNVRYPFPLNPPFIEKNNPCMVYVTNYQVTNLDINHYLNINGVDSCIYIYVNNKFVGYSTVSHSFIEFDLTKYLLLGNNELRLIVYKWNTMSYLEDQDKLRMTGIFRDIYILRRPKDHIGFYKLEANANGLLTFKTDKEVKLIFENQEYKGKNIVIHKQNPILWSAENPYLYDIKIEYNNEIINEKVGFRTISIDKNVFKLNGRPIKFKGVNRHSSTINGYVESIDDLIKDIIILKEHNINAIRTSHYPCHPELPYLCDKYGIYLLEEADIECHGIVFLKGNYDEKYYNLLASNKMYHDAIVYRQERMVYRDINRPSVLMWSLGNESGWGKNFKDASNKIKKIDSRPIHYERTFLGNSYGNKDEFGFAIDCKDYVDVYSRMYPSIDELNKMKGNLDKPFIMCEYSHAMGNSCGDLNDYEQIIENEPSFCGGFIWELINHCVYKNNKYLYGGDFKEKIHDGNFCMDGLVGIDRKLFPEIKDVKNIFSLVKIRNLKDNIYRIFNNFSFIKLNDYSLYYQLKENGKVIKEERIIIDDILPLSYKDINVEYINSNEFLTLDFILYKDNQISYTSQFVLNVKEYKHETINGFYKYEDNYFVNDFVINKNGMIYNNIKHENVFIKQANILIARAYIDNDRNRFDWFKAKLDTIKFKVLKINEKPYLSFEGKLINKKVDLGKATISYKEIEDGINVNIKVSLNNTFDYIPRFAYSLKLNKEFNKFSYFGYGSNESYIDRNQASLLGLHYGNVFAKDNFFNYYKPQESGSHFNTYFVNVNSNNETVKVISNTPFSFQVIPFELSEIKDHIHKMKYNSNHSILNIDYKMSGLGSNSCGPKLLSKYQLNEKEFEFDFDIIINKMLQK